MTAPKPRRAPPSDLQNTEKLLWRNVIQKNALNPAGALLHKLCRMTDELGVSSGSKPPVSQSVSRSSQISRQ
jgi:hypothetical protein